MINYILIFNEKSCNWLDFFLNHLTALMKINPYCTSHNKRDFNNCWNVTFVKFFAFLNSSLTFILIWSWIKHSLLILCNKYPFSVTDNICPVSCLSQCQFRRSRRELKFDTQQQPWTVTMLAVDATKFE